jgi:TonB family protein
LLALALGGFFYARTEAGQEAMARYAPALREQYDAFVERLNVLKREATAKTESSDQVSLAPSSSVDNSSQKNAPAREASALPPTAAPTPAPVEAQPVPPASAELPASVELKDRRSREAVGRARVDQSPNEPTGARLIQDSDTVRVAPGVMDANLVASRVPAYPEVAKAEGIQGPVVMEAVISKSGAVDHVRVIQGEKQLRSAAEEAVLKWRYRPYLLNGSPVDVATVIRVDFRLHAGNYSR